MEYLDLFQEPVEPAAVKAAHFEFWEGAGGVNARIVGKLGALDQIKDDGIFKADEHRPNALERERVLPEHKILGEHLARSLWSGRDELRDGAGL